MAALSVLLACLPAAGQESSFKGQVRPRYELRDPSGTGPDEWVSMRVRAALDATLDDGLSVFVQLQDVRYWGEEASTLNDYSADNLDLHQGYLRLRGARADWLTTTVGRQEASLGGERLVGPVGWTQQGRSFDGVRFDASKGAATLALLAFKTGEGTASPTATDADFVGVYGVLQDVGPGSVDVYWLHDRVSAAMRTRQHSVGARYVFTGPVRGRLEGTLQRGSRQGLDVRAYMFGARLGRSFMGDRADITLWYDHLSGDDDPADGVTRSFQTLFATNHKFYGFADLFTDVPAHTGGFGLRDLAFKAAWRPTATERLAVDLHRFDAAKRGTLSGSHFANEVDLTAEHRYSAHLLATAGFSYVLQAKPLGEVGRLSEDMTWVYVMLDAVF